jgi:hypothetical protein
MGHPTIIAEHGPPSSYDLPTVWSRSEPGRHSWDSRRFRLVRPRDRGGPRHRTRRRLDCDRRPRTPTNPLDGLASVPGYDKRNGDDGSRSRGARSTMRPRHSPCAARAPWDPQAGTTDVLGSSGAVRPSGRGPTTPQLQRCRRDGGRATATVEANGVAVGRTLRRGRVAAGTARGRHGNAQPAPRALRGAGAQRAPRRVTRSTLRPDAAR